eukprot:tig00021569_g22343.t1
MAADGRADCPVCGTFCESLRDACDGLSIAPTTLNPNATAADPAVPVANLTAGEARAPPPALPGADGASPRCPRSSARGPSWSSTGAGWAPSGSTPRRGGAPAPSLLLRLSIQPEGAPQPLPAPGARPLQLAPLHRAPRAAPRPASRATPEPLNRAPSLAHAQGLFATALLAAMLTARLVWTRLRYHGRASCSAPPPAVRACASP